MKTADDIRAIRDKAVAAYSDTTIGEEQSKLADKIIDDEFMPQIEKAAADRNSTISFSYPVASGGGDPRAKSCQGPEYKLLIKKLFDRGFSAFWEPDGPLVHLKISW